MVGWAGNYTGYASNVEVGGWVMSGGRVCAQSLGNHYRRPNAKIH